MPIAVVYFLQGATKRVRHHRGPHSHLPSPHHCGCGMIGAFAGVLPLLLLVSFVHFC